MATNLNSDPNDVTTTYTQPTVVPTAKVKAVGYAGIITSIVPLVIAVLAVFNVNVDPASAEAGTQMAIAFVAAIVTLYNIVSAVLQFLFGYFKKSDTANGAVKEI